MTNDPTTLRAEIARLRRTLTVLRSRYANLLAAVRAAVGAHRDGEPDPMAYLYDELPDHPANSAYHGDETDTVDGPAGSSK